MLSRVIVTIGGATATSAGIAAIKPAQATAQAGA